MPPFKTFKPSLPYGAAKAQHTEHPNRYAGDRYSGFYTRNPQVALVSNENNVTADLMAKTIASSLSPFEPVRPLAEELHLFHAAVLSVVDAVVDRVLTEKEGDAIIELMSRSLTQRRLDVAFMHLAKTKMPLLGTVEVE